MSASDGIETSWDWADNYSRPQIDDSVVCPGENFKIFLKRQHHSDVDTSVLLSNQIHYNNR